MTQVIPAASKPSRFAAVSGTYFTAHALLIVAGLVSMPVTTRLLPKEEYGLLSLVFATVSILAVVGTLGFGEATVRLYTERRTHGPEALRILCDSMLGGSLALSLLVAVVTVTAAAWIVEPSRPTYARCLQWSAVLVVIRVISGVLYQIYRAQERAFAHAAARVLCRYGTIAVAITLLLLSERSAFTVIVATVIVEAIVAGVRLFDLARRGVISRPRLAPPILAAATRYGLPLALAGSARFLLDSGDRFLIERFLGLNAVANYSVPYDLAQRLADGLFAPAGLAVMPILFRLWASEGRAVTSQFASTVLTYMVSIAIPVAALYLMFNQEIIVLLASGKYRESARLSPLILPGVLLSSMSFIAAAGLTVGRKTGVLALNVCSAAVLNLALNLLLIPVWGLSGAAVATTVAYGVLLVANVWWSRSVLDLRLRYAIVGRALLATACMIALLYGVGRVSSQSAVDCVVRGALGGTTAALCLWILDPKLRQWAWLWLSRGNG